MTEPCDCLNDNVLMVLKLQDSAAKRGHLNVWTIYDHPNDYPHGFCARRHEVTNHGKVQATNHFLYAGPRPDELQDVFREAGLHKIDRFAEDDPRIVETWI